MATLTQVMLTCDLCGNAKDVQTRTVGLDGQTYEIDLCRKDSNGLSEAAAGYMSKARKITARRSPRRNGRKPRSRAENAASRERAMTSGRKISDQGRAGSTQEEAETGRSERQSAKASGAKAKASGSTQEAKASRSERQKMKAASTQAAKATGTQRQKGIYVYGILPADIEIAAEMPGIGEHPGLLRVICSDGLAALISEVDLSERLGSPDDLRTHSEILDATATEVPVLPLRFGTVLANEDAVADELLAARHDEFADALEELEGRAEFLGKGRYVEEGVPGEVLPGNEPAGRRPDNTQGKDPAPARGAGSELGDIIN
jgi:Gas vesicle synthesis protein GvpL/GvpF/Lsr2